MELCLFDPSGQTETARFALPEWTDEVWHGFLPDAAPGLVYGYRAHGTFGQPNPFGGYMNMVWPLGAGLLLAVIVAGVVLVVAVGLDNWFRRRR